MDLIITVMIWIFLGTMPVLYIFVYIKGFLQEKRMKNEIIRIIEDKKIYNLKGVEKVMVRDVIYGIKISDDVVDVIWNDFIKNNKNWESLDIFGSGKDLSNIGTDKYSKFKESVEKNLWSYSDKINKKTL